jgi:hypothetical protein
MTDTVTSQREAYEAAFSGKSEAETKRAKALEVALDVRKFEIELYWKRASYFWVWAASTISSGHDFHSCRSLGLIIGPP